LNSINADEEGQKDSPMLRIESSQEEAIVINEGKADKKLEKRQSSQLGCLQNDETEN